MFTIRRQLRFIRNSGGGRDGPLSPPRSSLIYIWIPVNIWGHRDLNKLESHAGNILYTFSVLCSTPWKGWDIFCIMLDTVEGGGRIFCIMLDTVEGGIFCIVLDTVEGGGEFLYYA